MKTRVFKTLRKKSRRNILNIFILVLVSFVLISLFFKDNTQNQFFSKEINDFIRNIRNISAIENKLSFSFTNSMNLGQFRDFSKHLILLTKAFDRPLILNHESILNITLESESKLNIYFDFPFVMNYFCYISIFSKIPTIHKHHLSQQSIIKSITRKSIKTYKLFVNITSFANIYNNHHTSHLQCFGNDSLTRWCDMRDIGYIRTRLLFYTNSIYTFPSPFMSIGCRSPPFDIIEDRLYDEPMVTRPNFSISYTYNYTDITYIVGRFHNSMMMWHVLFDFMIPLYWTINEIESGFRTASNRTILLRDSQYQILIQFMQTFSKNPIRNIKNDRKSHFFNRAIVGLPKFEKNPLKNRRISDMATFEYNFDENVSIGLREVVMKGFDIEDRPINHSNPIVIYVSRENSPRDLTNSEKVLDLMRETCTFCQIKSVTFHQLSPRSQIEAVSRASVLVGLHGSGLTHSLWLPRSNATYESVLFEILPYKYWCRNWYKTAARVAGVDYFSTMNTGRIRPDVHKSVRLKYDLCSLKKSSCRSIECNDLLKDQKFQMELDTFNSTWIKIVKILEKNRENEKRLYV